MELLPIYFDAWDGFIGVVEETVFGVKVRVNSMFSSERMFLP